MAWTIGQRAESFWCWTSGVLCAILLLFSIIKRNVVDKIIYGYKENLFSLLICKDGVRLKDFILELVDPI